MRKGPMPLGTAIALLIIGIFLGSISSFGMQYWNKEVTREECSIIETQFLKYENIRQPKRPATIKEIAIDCANGERYFIDGASIDSKLTENLSNLVCGENITLFIHPNGNAVVELSTNSGTILSFSETIDELTGEAIGFLFLGLFMYFCSLVGLYHVVWQCIEKRKRRAK